VLYFTKPYVNIILGFYINLFWIRLQYIVVYELNRSVIRTNCDTILLRFGHYISIIWLICWKNLVNLMEIKWENFRYLDTKGWGSLAEVQSFKIWILENQKRVSARDSWVRKHRIVFGSNLDDSWEIKRENP